jgi:hypothetical protein
VKLSCAKELKKDDRQTKKLVKLRAGKMVNGPIQRAVITNKTVITKGKE